MAMKHLAVFTNDSLNQFCSNWCFCSNCFALNWFVQNCDSFHNNTSDLIQGICFNESLNHSFSRFIQKMLTHSETKHHCYFAWNDISINASMLLQQCFQAWTSFELPMAYFLVLNYVNCLLKCCKITCVILLYYDCCICFALGIWQV